MDVVDDRMLRRERNGARAKDVGKLHQHGCIRVFTFEARKSRADRHCIRGNSVHLYLR